MSSTSALQPTLETLRALESGLRAELHVLRTNGANQSLEEANSLLDFQIPSLLRTRDFLASELQRTQTKLNSSLSSLRELSTHNDDGVDKEAENQTEEDLRKEVILLRRRTLQFAKTQYPLLQDEDFEGGDFWDACVSHCASPLTEVEFSVEREGAFAELLIQSGIFERVVRGGDAIHTKRIRLVKEVFMEV